MLRVSKSEYLFDPLQQLRSPSVRYLLFDPKNGLHDPKNLSKESKQHRNRAKFHLSCFQRLGNRFSGAGSLGNIRLHHFLHRFYKSGHKTQEFVPQVLKQVVNLSCYLCPLNGAQLEPKLGHVQQLLARQFLHGKGDGTTSAVANQLWAGLVLNNEKYFSVKQQPILQFGTSSTTPLLLNIYFTGLTHIFFNVMASGGLYSLIYITHSP